MILEEAEEMADLKSAEMMTSSNPDLLSGSCRFSPSIINTSSSSSCINNNDSASTSSTSSLAGGKSTAELQTMVDLNLENQKLKLENQSLKSQMQLAEEMNSQLAIDFDVEFKKANALERSNEQLSQKLKKGNDENEQLRKQLDQVKQRLNEKTNEAQDMSISLRESQTKLEKAELVVINLNEELATSKFDIEKLVAESGKQKVYYND